MIGVLYRIVLVLSIGVLLGGTGAVYNTKYDARQAAKRLSDLRHDITQEEELISVLRAEWSLLNEPSRLEDLASRYLELAPLEVGQMATIRELPHRPHDLGPMGLDPIGGFAGSGLNVQ